MQLNKQEVGQKESTREQISFLAFSHSIILG